MRASPNFSPMVAFGLVAVACLAPAPRAPRTPPPSTRRSGSDWSDSSKTRSAGIRSRLARIRG